MPFLGTFEYQMDDRNRIALPPEFREEFEAGAVMTTGTEPCVLVYTPGGFDRAAAAIEAIPDETEEGREARRDFYSNAFKEKKDGQGRLLLRSRFISHAGLRKEVAVVGAGGWIEIWDRPTWEARAAERAAARKAGLAGVAARKSAQHGSGA